MADAKQPAWMAQAGGIMSLLSGAIVLFEQLIDHLGQQPKHLETLAQLKEQHAQLSVPSATEPAAPAPVSPTSATAPADNPNA
jgi:hypothetical protein